MPRYPGLARMGVADECLKRMVAKLGGLRQLERFEEFVMTWANAELVPEYGGDDDVGKIQDDGQKLVARGNYPGLTEHVPVRAGRPAWADALEKAAPQIEAELVEAQAAQAFQGDGFFGGKYGQGYSGIALARHCAVVDGAAEAFPKTLAALSAVADSERPHDDHDVGLGCTIGATRLAFFAKQKAQTHVELHSDNVNWLVTAHLGLQVPDDGEVALFFPHFHKSIRWQKHQLAPLLQTSFEHAAVNDSPKTNRTILYFDLFHPELSGAERQGLRLFDELRRGLSLPGTPKPPAKALSAREMFEAQAAAAV
ncbi:hypothetical protein M885DRAFT_618036 [Pelagophyceae sp. CCMP2097]|nr:hypothetical protein M885DRAFT_618036 [Pelagophyceae sp. CCMP2097]|mmetsp:Transcript_31535/g.108445  ORF Transcript_31535/g.108445 Transcript_31535/m.108445 type:complete len:311 (+) Transcript_31535:26-958(+)